ncbi:MAG TPA: laccase domain-containing protein [Candidatus Dormibacteraeota bacterium]|nr:laccase domain-containing protein [Candidatus Dormibacteraeota bacterium]
MTDPEVTHIVEAQAEIVYSGKALGNVDTRTQFGDPEVALVNRQRLIDVLDPAHYVLQVVQLGPDFLDLSDIADEDLEPSYPTDGLFINRPNIALGLNTADCSAITMYDAREGGAMGLIHGGRQGVDGDIHLAALEHITGVRGVPKEHLRLHFAPAIRAASYYYPELSAEQMADPKWKDFITLAHGNYHIDLLGRIIRELTDAGIEPEQMEINPIDVGAHLGYFSHARSNRTGEPRGRNGIAAVLRPAIAA